MCEIILGWNVFVLSYAWPWAKMSIGNCRCKCGSCQRLNRVVECICCAEIDCVVAKNNDAVEAEGLAEPPICITQHPGFHTVCLNRWVLQTAWYQYKQQYQDSYEGPSHKQNRHSLQAVGEVVLGSFEKGSASCSAIMCCLLHTSALPSCGDRRRLRIWRIVHFPVLNCFNTV